MFNVQSSKFNVKPALLDGINSPPKGGAGRGSFFSEANLVVGRRQGAVEERYAVGVEVEGDGGARVVP